MSIRFAFACALVPALCLAAPASAQVSVIGGGLARDCFEAAKYQYVSAKEGEALCSKALQLEVMKHSNRTATYTNRGVLRMRLGQYDSALADYATAKRMNPALGEIYLNEGAALIFKKDYTNALAALNKSVELGSAELYAAHYNRAIARENTGDVPGAYADFQKSLELFPEFELAKQQLTRFIVTPN
jgi:tetratricopeptide (TPR) repeat protein